MFVRSHVRMTHLGAVACVLCLASPGPVRREDPSVARPAPLPGETRGEVAPEPKPVTVPIYGWSTGRLIEYLGDSAPESAEGRSAGTGAVPVDVSLAPDPLALSKFHFFKLSPPVQIPRAPEPDVEPSVGASTSGVLLEGNMRYLGLGYGPRFYISYNYGASWQPASAPGGSLNGSNFTCASTKVGPPKCNCPGNLFVGYSSVSDVVIAPSGPSSFLMTYALFDCVSGPCPGADAIYVMWSDTGLHQRPNGLCDVLGTFGNLKSCELCHFGTADAGPLRDKPFITADLLDGSWYVVYASSQSPLATTMDIRLAGYSSALGFLGFGVSSPITLNTAAPNARVGAVAATGPSSELYVAWWDLTQSTIQFNASFDMAQSFGGEQMVTAVQPFPLVPFGGGSIYVLPPQGSGVNGGFRMNQFPTMDVDRGPGGHRGRIYIAWADYDGVQSDILLIHSDDQGFSWSAPVVINDDGTGRDQFFPALTVDDGGNVMVAFYDRRDDPQNLLCRPYLAVSTDGGRSFLPNKALAQTLSDPTLWTVGGVTFFGDYMGIDAQILKPNVLAATTTSVPRASAVWTDAMNFATQHFEIYGRTVR